MTGEHLGFVRKQVKFLPDVGNQGLMVATRQISAANALQAHKSKGCRDNDPERGIFGIEDLEIRANPFHQ